MNERILVVYGGISEEREVSLRSGCAIAQSLRKCDFVVQELDFNGRIEDVLEKFKPDVVFIALHGPYGEDGTIQGALEIMGIPYTGSAVLQSALCMNKLFSKYLFNYFNIPTPPFLYLEDKDLTYDKASESLLSDRIVVKPVDLGSTIGVSIVSDEKSFRDALNLAFSFSRGVIVERFIKGIEITISVIGNEPDIRVLPAIEIVPVHEYYDYFSKYTPGMSNHIIPARIPKQVQELASDIARKVYVTFKLRDFSRVDFMIGENTPYVLEVNTIPGFTDTSLLPDAAKAAGISFDDLVEFIVNEALKRKQ